MDKTSITVTMPLSEFEHLRAREQQFDRFIRMFENANVDGTAVMTEELRQTIEDIYC